MARISWHSRNRRPVHRGTEAPRPLEATRIMGEAIVALSNGRWVLGLSKSHNVDAEFYEAV